MSKNSLTKKQLKVLEELFSGELSEQEILKKNHIKRFVYNEWLNDRNFIEYFYRRIKGFNLQSRLIVARYAPVAAAKLVELTESDKAETARKACLDVMSMPDKFIGDRSQKGKVSKIKMSEEAAAKVMKILAEDKPPKNE